MSDNPIHRRLFAQQMLARAFVQRDERLLTAMSRVSREAFAGPPPWYIRDQEGYRALPSEDPLVLYQDVLIGLDMARAINNGSPSLHVGLLHKAAVQEGEHVVHLGAGSGYYSAILAELVGPSGQVTAVEYDAKLADMAKAALASYKHVQVVHGSAFDWPREKADVIYVNFALDHPPARWVDNLYLNGRLIFPFGVPAQDASGGRTGVTARAGMLMIERRTAGFEARFLQGVSFIWAEGLEEVAGRHESVMRAFRSGGHGKIRSLRWGVQAPHRQPANGNAPDEQASAAQEWYGEESWGLSFDML
ncbi:protein-L-isoaspartate O-methyltransferase [Rhizobium sp. SSA_523]|uniref:protein-L-isoaspartate O-methyltransferase family protein n=1 Tax=Rhizobium sp. SSA_523 TaxID=2952477 RepID=UPI002091B2FD|nr:methyltransferase domain-containing protein [Rhizobium sp. SSA_523]MCO5730800.1 methyltransferase domain-containing protein [Rhizobium sp. SSA_523]WKC24377.1 rRNA adenine N-6-methyltransferase family protein [Rhizobium sp. SSA_523]